MQKIVFPLLLMNIFICLKLRLDSWVDDLKFPIPFVTKELLSFQQSSENFRTCLPDFQ
jgi:hypothetical protein